MKIPEVALIEVKLPGQLAMGPYLAKRFYNYAFNTAETKREEKEAKDLRIATQKEAEAAERAKQEEERSERAKLAAAEKKAAQAEAERSAEHSKVQRYKAVIAALGNYKNDKAVTKLKDRKEAIANFWDDPDSYLTDYENNKKTKLDPSLIMSSHLVALIQFVHANS